MPTITSFTPIAAAPGQPVTITGSGFTGATAVKFGGVDALYFRIISDTSIEAFPNYGGTNIISVTGPGGTGSQSGFTLLLTRVRFIDLPTLNRNVGQTDILAVWDIIRNKLCQAPVSAFPAGTGGGGGGDDGNVFTALGSPFKVRVGDDNYDFVTGIGDDAPGSVIINDVRLLGKTNFVVYATDLSNEFENTRLVFDEDAGSVTIKNYQLSAGSHITIYADGVVTTQFTDYVASQQALLNKLLVATAPMRPSLDSGGNLQPGGVILPWFRPAIEIPAGWTEWLPGRGRGLVGQDPTAPAYDATTNPDSLNQANGTAVGLSGGSAVITLDNLPVIQLKMFSGASSGGNLNSDGNRTVAWSSNHSSGNQDYDMKVANDSNASLGNTSAVGKTSPDPIKNRLNPNRIVNFIYSNVTS